jgi:hypothetical protein
MENKKCLKPPASFSGLKVGFAMINNNTWEFTRKNGDLVATKIRFEDNK